ncbi:major membrane immunogen (membrane-anchored lipoprotein) [Lactobacillus colini]|uniref:Major membrane immunogen (Membrane-anchored lipoprotein) n=1 Tax=Lactobacillus colini TaxID=1819254 RepID=A0ABS4MDI1_9LACO|nr:extracellular electron transfer flavoprotein PplA [Lactobacillus colini]MBP2057747.1 major membrane immunogen (membrane-anchored lipoprotein) [Lactobacillus colini]
MKVKKIIYGVSMAALSALMLTACSTTASNSSSSKSSSSTSKTTQVKKQKVGKQVAGAKLKDGTYKLVEDNYSHGYKVTMSMTVKDGKVVDASYDQVNKDGKSKTKDASYEKQMKKYSKVGPKEYIDILSKEFKENGANVSGIQTVSGATHSSDSMRNYANQLVQAAQKGDTATIHINNGAKYKDGTYKLETLNYDHGYHQVYTLVIKNGKVADLTYDQLNKKGVSKTKNTSYEKQMKKYSKVGPKEYIAKLKKEFLDNNGNMEKVQVVSGATESSNDFIAYVSQLLNAAQKGNTKTIKVDNIIYKE